MRTGPRNVWRLALTWEEVQRYSRGNAAVEREQAGAARLRALSRQWAEAESLVG